MSAPFRFLQPTFYAGLFDDPVLLVTMRSSGRALLLDCGRIHHLAKRVLRALDAVFVSHAHMDHFMGFDTLIRHLHVAPKTLDVFGPPGLAARVASKMRSYDWNLAAPFWCDLRVHEIGSATLRTTLLEGKKGFREGPSEERARRDRTIYANRCLHVEAELCDHQIPSLVFKVTASAPFAVDAAKIESQGLINGPWLEELNRLYCAGRLLPQPLTVLRRRHGGSVAELCPDAAALYASIAAQRPADAIGYIADVGWSAENRARLRSLLQGVTLLVCECTFLAAERAKARASHHLCSADVNTLLEDLRPRSFLPMHLSKAYLRDSRQLYRELSPPPGVTVLKIPDSLTPRPLLPQEIPAPRCCRRGGGRC